MPHIKNSQDLANKLWEIIIPDLDETIVFFFNDATSLFTCMSTQEAGNMKTCLLGDSTMSSRTNFILDHTGALTVKDSTDRRSCAMGSTVSLIVASRYIEEVESRALITFTGSAPSHWFRYVDYTGVKIWTSEVEAFTEHINAADINPSSHGKMSEEKVCLSWTVQYTLRKTEASTLRWTENLHTQINTRCLTLITHWSTSTRVRRRNR